MGNTMGKLQKQVSKLCKILLSSTLLSNALACNSSERPFYFSMTPEDLSDSELKQRYYQDSPEENFSMSQTVDEIDPWRNIAYQVKDYTRAANSFNKRSKEENGIYIGKIIRKKNPYLKIEIAKPEIFGMESEIVGYVNHQNIGIYLQFRR